MTIENLHVDSLEDHLFTDKEDTSHWLERVREILEDLEPGEDPQASLVAALKADTREQLRGVKLLLSRSSKTRDMGLQRAFLDFATDTLDDILFDQDFEALATRLLKAHREA